MIKRCVLKEAYLDKWDADINWQRTLVDAMDRCNRKDWKVLEEEARLRERDIFNEIQVDERSKSNLAIDHIRKEALKELKKRILNR